MKSLQVVVDLISGTQKATQQLDVHISDAQLAHETQLDIYRSATQLSDVLTQLTHHVNMEIENINNTVVSVTDHLLFKVQDRYNSEIWTQISACITWMLRTVLCGE